MSAGIPVMIHLSRDTFVALEAAAKRRGIRMSELIEAGLDRSIQPKPILVNGQVPSPKRAAGRGNRRLDAAEWAECKQLKQAGWTVPELAVKYGCSSSAIYFRLRREQ
jgi:hypothetical protein